MIIILTECGSQSIYFDKVRDFVTAARISGLPVIGVEIPAHHLAPISLNPECLNDDDVWRNISHSLGSDRNYGEALRTALQKLQDQKEPPPFAYIFSLREQKPLIIQLNIR